ncbi:MAG TPA: thioredoxin domain-containing protein [Pyrinomonadaceae bacterium]|nr:thioredoxin domain-containing protein [Pyrinomonadaceae bacterium]
MTKLAILISILLFSASAVPAQKPTDVLATAKGHKFTVADLSAEAQAEVAGAPADLKKFRTELLNEMIASKALSLEAASKGLTVGRLIADLKTTLPAPTDAEIKVAYDANKEALGDVPLEKARQPIVDWLNGKKHQEAVVKLVTELQTKYKAAKVKDVNAANLAAADVLATIGTDKVTRSEFDRFVKYDLYEFEAKLADDVLADLDEAIFNTLVSDEAKATGVESSSIIAREITNKMVDFSDEEHARLNADFGKRLTAKYGVALLYKAPEQPVETVSTDDDPAEGPANAPVTVIMFSDFQCSACSATHPILKTAIAAFPGKVRLVIRDFPLESVHDNSMLAARAASAANAQGKFFEFIEILYKSQDKLDTASLKKYAADLGLDAAKFDADMNSDKTLTEIKKDIADGEALHINSTPTIFINGRRIDRISVEGFKAAIEQALKK